MSTAPPGRGHIEGLDGVRGFAVLAVVAFHLWPQRVPGGFLGVDVFFVLSGFLITTLLLRERGHHGYVDAVSFWRRRARRLLPALLLVVPVSVLAAALVERDLLVGIDRQVVGAATFSSNWLEILAGSDYFDTTAPALFETFWSLAVEEQFYVLWPIGFGLIMALAPTTRPRVQAAAAVAVASAAYMALFYSPADPTRVYYGTATHLFGLLFGAALAFAGGGRPERVGGRRWRRWRSRVGPASLVGLIVLMLTVRGDEAFAYRGGIVLASLLTVGVIAALPGSPTAFQSLHRLAPLEWVGARSYGIYLWHWPVILIVTAALPPVAPGAGPSLPAVALALTVTLALSAASYRWVEVPVRRDGFVAMVPAVAPRLVTAAGAAMILVVGGVVLTAPSKSAAQLAVERGQREIEQANQQDPAPVGELVEAPSPTSSTAPPVTAWPTVQPVPAGESISAFGDSVLSGAAPAMYERFPGIHLDAVPIRQWKDAPAVVERAAASGSLRRAVVLNFGTNAGLVDAHSVDGLRATLDLIGPDRRVVVVNIVGVSEWVPSSNALLAEVASGRDNVVVADWRSIVHDDPSLLHPDRTHPNWNGIAVYAEMVAAAFERLGPGDT